MILISRSQWSQRSNLFECKKIRNNSWHHNIINRTAIKVRLGIQTHLTHKHACARTHTHTRARARTNTNHLFSCNVAAIPAVIYTSLITHVPHSSLACMLAATLIPGNMNISAILINLLLCGLIIASYRQRT